MSFIKSFTPMYYICDNTHKYLVSTLEGVNSNFGTVSIKLQPIDDAYAFEAKYHYWRPTEDIEELHDVLDILKTVTGKPFKYRIEGDKKIELNIEKFELIKAVPSITCFAQSDDYIDTMYKEAIAKKLSKKRCRINNLLKKLDITKLSDNDISRLEKVLE